MRTQLKNILSIRTGLFAKPALTGDVLYLQSKHFNDSGQIINHSLLPDLNSSDISDKHILKKDDILFSAKGTKNFATVFNIKELKCVASTSFLILSCKNSDILPEFIAFFLNHPNTQTILKEQAMGTSIPSISKQTLENVEITIPSLEKQRLVIKLHHLYQTEKLLRRQISELREIQIQQQIINAIT